MNKETIFFVSRQIQFPDGEKVVEVNSGGKDYCNPGAVSKKYPGEFREYESAVEAVNVAKAIAELWQKDCGEEIGIGVGCTMGFTMPFSGESYEKALEWAKSQDGR